MKTVGEFINFPSWFLQLAPLSFREIKMFRIINYTIFLNCVFLDPVPGSTLSFVIKKAFAEAHNSNLTPNYTFNFPLSVSLWFILGYLMLPEFPAQKKVSQPNKPQNWLWLSSGRVHGIHGSPDEVIKSRRVCHRAWFHNYTIYSRKLFGSMLFCFRWNVKRSCHREKVIDVVLMISGNQVLRWCVIYQFNNSFSVQRCRYALATLLTLLLNAFCHTFDCHRRWKEH